MNHYKKTGFLMVASKLGAILPADNMMQSYIIIRALHLVIMARFNPYVTVQELEKPITELEISDK
jgi:hypothetical protein